MRSHSFVAFLIILTVAVLAVAQAPNAPAAKASPEMSRLAKLFVGDWDTVETMERSEFFPNGGGRQAHFGQPGAQAVLASDERRTSSGTTLLAVVIGETHAFLGNPVDIGCVVAHQTERITAQIGHADIVAPADDDVRLC